MTPLGIEPATFRFVAQRLNHCATAVPRCEHVIIFLCGGGGSEKTRQTWAQPVLCGVSLQARKATCEDSLGVLYEIMTGARYESSARNTTERSPTVQPTNQICWNLRSSMLAEMSNKYGVSWFQKIQHNVQNILPLTLIVLMWRIGWAHNNARK